MQKILTLKRPDSVPDYMYVLAIMGTMNIQATKEPPEEGDLLAYYTDTRMFTGVRPNNLATLKEALKDEVEVIEYDNPQRFTEGVTEEYFRYLDTLPPDKGMRLRFQMLERAATILQAIDNKGKTGNCGKGTLHIIYGVGGKTMERKLCVACAEAAVAGNDMILKTFAKPETLRALLVVALTNADRS